MNLRLQKEILLYVMKKFGLFLENDEVQPGFINKLTDDKYLSNKKLVFEAEDKKKYQNNVWAITAKVEASKLKILIADIHEDIAEYTIIFQMDNLPAYALRLSAEDNDFGSIYVNAKDNKWIPASMSVQAKFLFGVEGISEIPLTWERLDDIQDVYKLLIQFMNYYERE